MKVLVTAGPTREPIDAVRYLGNRSSGRMGIAIAQAAAAAGHDVTLLLGPVSAALPESASQETSEVSQRLTIQRFETAAELQSLLTNTFKDHDLLIMAAAVADYRPVVASNGKLKRTGEAMRIDLEPVPDLVASIASTKRDDQRIIAFALEEPANVESRGLEKMRRKNVDAIVANPLRTMNAQTIEPIYLTATGERLQPDSSDKTDFAAWLIHHATDLFKPQVAHS